MRKQFYCLRDIAVTAKMRLQVQDLNSGLVFRKRRNSKGILGCEYAAGKTGLRNLLFDGEDVRSLRENLQAKNGWISRKEAADQLGVKDPVLKKWVDSTLLKPVHELKNIQYFDRRDIDVFYETYIFCDEAAKIIGIGELVVQKWARNGRLHPVSGPGIDNCHRYLFLRSEVNQLTPEKRRTAAQLAHDLGISRSQIIQWVKAGKIKPVSGPGIDGSSHYLFITYDSNCSPMPRAVS